MTLYRFRVDGGIDRETLPPGANVNDLLPSQADPAFDDADGLYMFSFAVDPDAGDDRDYFFLMHNVNDAVVSEHYKSSARRGVPTGLNLALRRFFPEAPVLGNLLLVRVDGELIQPFTDLEELRNYELLVLDSSTDTQGMTIRKKEA